MDILFTSSYVYIRLVLVTLLAGKIQRGNFSIAVLPTVTFFLPRFILVLSLLCIGLLLPEHYPLLVILYSVRLNCTEYSYNPLYLPSHHSLNVSIAVFLLVCHLWQLVHVTGLQTPMGMQVWIRWVSMGSEGFSGRV
jgi:hypothetical protein